MKSQYLGLEEMDSPEVDFPASAMALALASPRAFLASLSFFHASSLALFSFSFSSSTGGVASDFSGVFIAGEGLRSRSRRSRERERRRSSLRLSSLRSSRLSSLLSSLESRPLESR